MAKYTAEIKIAACKEFLDGKLSHREICQKYGISFTESSSSSILNEWILRYQVLGENAFIKTKGNRSYHREEKVRIVEEYLAGKGSLQLIAAKYGIPSKETLRRWILKYNANRELKDYNPRREVYMAEVRRKTTIEERKEIVEYCLSHDRDYKAPLACMMSHIVKCIHGLENMMQPVKKDCLINVVVIKLMMK